jgi:hypothetical protein
LRARAQHVPRQEQNTDYHQIVPACKAYTIKWTPTTPNAVSILLLRGPSTNVVPLGAPLAEGIANSGSFSWTPSASLEADTTHYGLQLIDDITGQYQYSTQFGISKDACEAVVSSVIPSSAVASTTDAGYGYGYPTETPVAETTSSAHGGYGAPSSVVSSTAIYTPVTSAVASTGYPISNSTILQPSKSLSVPESLKTTASGGLTPSSTGSAPPEFTGAASGIRAGLGLAGAVAGLVFML